MTYDGKNVGLWQLRNAAGTEAWITNFGARLTKLVFGGIDIVQGFDTPEEYFPERYDNYFGAVVGRYANRLKDGRITVEGRTYQLPVNNGPNCLHGGPKGWQNCVFDVVVHSTRHLTLTLVSPDGDQGFPGTVKVRVTYSLDDDNALRIDYSAESDLPTVINMTNHSYFNLSDNLGSSMLDHTLWIDADRYTPTDDTAIPLENHLSVEGTPMDFRTPKTIGRDINADYSQLKVGSGYDHNYVLNTRGSLDRSCARLSCAATGITLEVYTSAPGMQLYSGNFIDGTPGKGGIPYPRRSAVCLETQQYPDSPNRQWPESTGRLLPGSPFKSTTIYKLCASR